MSTINSTDIFLVNRNGTSYKVTAENLVAKLQAGDYTLINRGGTTYKAAGIDGITNAAGTDLMVVNRGGTTYKVTCSDVQAQWLLKWFTPTPYDIGADGIQMLGMATNNSGRTVALTFEPSVTLTFNGGANWSARSGLQYPMRGIHYVPGNDMFIAGPYGATRAFTSTDGLSWTQKSQQIPFGNSTVGTAIYTTDVKSFDDFATPRIMLCSDQGVMAYCTKDSAWQTASFFNSQYDLTFQKMALGNTGQGIVTLGVSASNSQIWYTPNGGVSWQPAGTTSGGQNYRWAAWNPDNNKFYALTYTTNTTFPQVWISGAGNPASGTATSTNLPASMTTRGLVYNTYDNHFYTPGAHGTSVAYRSPDCITWEEERIPGEMNPSIIHYSGTSVIQMSSFRATSKPYQYTYRPDQ